MTWTFHPIAHFPQHAARWDELARARGHVAFLESPFLIPLLKEFGDGQEVLALYQRAHEHTLGAGAILRQRGRMRWELFIPSQLPLGCWISPDANEQPLERQLHELLSALPGFALSLGLPQIDSLQLARPAAHNQLRVQDYIDTAWVDVEGSFDAYWDARGKNLRQNCKKQRNKLAAEGVHTSLECLTTPEAVEQALQDYGNLETTGWKAGQGTAIHPDNAQGRFYRAMLENYCALGRGRIYRYKFDDKVVAMDLCIESGPVLIILKTAYDESFRTVSPTTLMRQEQFQRIFTEARHARIEFYGKVMEWHTRWTGTARQIYHMTYYRWPVLGSLHAQVEKRRQRAAAASEPEAPLDPAPLKE